VELRAASGKATDALRSGALAIRASGKVLVEVLAVGPRERLDLVEGGGVGARTGVRCIRTRRCASVAGVSTESDVALLVFSQSFTVAARVIIDSTP
jgi:hypothetical protein